MKLLKRGSNFKLVIDYMQTIFKRLNYNNFQNLLEQDLIIDLQVICWLIYQKDCFERHGARWMSVLLVIKKLYTIEIKI